MRYNGQLENSDSGDEHELHTADTPSSIRTYTRRRSRGRSKLTEATYANTMRDRGSVSWLSASGFRGSPGCEQQDTKSFVYKKTKQADLELVVHYPPGWKETDKRPAIVFFFGGGWTGGKIEQFEPQASHLASRGMVAVRADYRVKSRHGVTPKECVEDAKTAIRWVRTKAANSASIPTESWLPVDLRAATLPPARL